MSFLKSKTAIKAGELIGRDIMKKVSDFTNELETWTSKNPLNAKTAIKAGEFIGRDIMKKVSDFTNELETWTSKNPLNAKTANYPNEDEYMREHNRKKKNASTYSNEANIENIPPMQRDVSTWSKKDLDEVMQSKEYQHDDITQKKVKSYFDKKYSKSPKLDATGRPY